MKKVTNTGHGILLSLQTLTDLQRKGFRYVLVKSYSRDNRPDYMEPYYFVLEPLVDLPEDINQKGIYEPLDSQRLSSWANFPGEGAQVFVAPPRP